MTWYRPRGRAILLAAIVMLALGGGSAAFGWWSASGMGIATVTTGSAAAVSIEAGPQTPALYPGGRASVTASVTNPNTWPVHISALSLNTAAGTSGYAVDASHSGCALTALNYETQTNGITGWTVPARAGTAGIPPLAITLPDALRMDVTASNACQGATFTVYLVAR